ncbi:hypothetical protein AB7310_11385, partial [Cylindrospermopsis raciborskii UAM/DH-BiRr]|uniref:hypothetical protein n=1 Tax=Cylindrospermopsis raciborskii TaxID=77022 RepID=UPI0038792A4D
PVCDLLSLSRVAIKVTFARFIFILSKLVGMEVGMGDCEALPTGDREAISMGDTQGINHNC